MISILKSDTSASLLDKYNLIYPANSSSLASFMYPHNKSKNKNYLVQKGCRHLLAHLSLTVFLKEFAGQKKIKNIKLTDLVFSKISPETTQK